MSKGSSSQTPAHGSPVTLRIVLPQPSRLERPESEMRRISLAASSSGMWWSWMFWRVVMWPLFSGAHSSITSANMSICSGVMPPMGSFVRIIWTFAWRWPYTPCLSRNLMNSVSSVCPSRNFVASVSKSSNSCSRIGITWPGTFSTISGFSIEPLRPFRGAETGSISGSPAGRERLRGGTIQPKAGRVSGFYPTDPVGNRTAVPCAALSLGSRAALCDRAALGIQRLAGLDPGREPTRDRVGVPSRCLVRLRGHAGAVARAAVEDDGLVAVERLGGCGELRHLDVARAGDVPLFVLVSLAHVDELRALEGSDLVRRELAHACPHGERSPGCNPTFSNNPARSHGFISVRGAGGGGAVSRRNCSIAATTAAASSGEAALWRISIRGRAGACLPFRPIGA